MGLTECHRRGTDIVVLHQATPRTVLPAVPRIIAIGDLHGDLEKARRAFRLGGLIDENDRWVGGTTTAVQVRAAWWLALPHRTACVPALVWRSRAGGACLLDLPLCIPSTCTSGHMVNSESLLWQAHPVAPVMLSQVGDQLDRGNQEIEILYFLERLEREAAAAGGALHVLNGELLGRHRPAAAVGAMAAVPLHWWRMQERCRV